MILFLDWTSASTNSVQFPGIPFVNVISVSDSAIGGRSTGLIYFYITDLDFTAKDLNADDRISLLFTEEQGLSCSARGEDAMEPTCARIIITGKRRILEENTREWLFARIAMTSRHPSVLNWEKEHKFYLCKVEIDQVIVLDFYGGANYVTAEDYYRANYDWPEAVENNHVNADRHGKEIYIKIDSTNSDTKVIHIEV